MAYQYREYDGYGRFSNRIISALHRLGAEICPSLTEMKYAPESTKILANWASNDTLTIQCLPVFFAVPVPGRNWLWSMTEGSELPDNWAARIAAVRPERIIVPCEYNAIAFEEGMRKEGFEIPVHVINGGVDTAEFFPRPVGKYAESDAAYTFMVLGDRGARKGWTEVWNAFYREFGTHKDTPNVRLILKSRPVIENDIVNMIAEADNRDPRVTVLREDADDMRDVWVQADCVVIPSRSEGFGMPHREAAATGTPVIVHKYAALDDGYIDKWATCVVENGTIEKIPSMYEHIKGEWRKPDIDEIARHMRWCFENRHEAALRAQKCAQWLDEHQTWDHTARNVFALMEEV